MPVAKLGQGDSLQATVKQLCTMRLALGKTRCILLVSLCVCVISFWLNVYAAEVVRAELVCQCHASQFPFEICVFPMLLSWTTTHLDVLPCSYVELCSTQKMPWKLN